MARKSRVAGNVIDIVPVKNGVYHTGIYARLSSEDREEDIVENQIYLLKSHVEVLEYNHRHEMLNKL